MEQWGQHACMRDCGCSWAAEGTGIGTAETDLRQAERPPYQCRFILDVHHVVDGRDVGGVPEDAAGVEIHRADGLRVHAEVGKLALGQLIKKRVIGRQGRRIYCRG